MESSICLTGEAKDEGAAGDENHTPIIGHGTVQQQNEDNDELEDKNVSLLVLWYGENQTSPMYSLIRQTTSFTAYEEGSIAKPGESLVPLIKSTLRKSSPDSAESDTVACSAGYDGGDEDEATPGGDDSGVANHPKSNSNKATKIGIGIEDFMAAGSSSSPSSKNNKLDKKQHQDMVEVTLLREDSSDAFDGVENDNSSSKCANTTDHGFTAVDDPDDDDDDKEVNDHDDIEVLWTEKEETSDSGSGGGPDDLIQQVMDKFLVEVKVEEEWNNEEQEQEEQDEPAQDDKYAIVSAGNKPESDVSTMQQQQQQQQQEKEEPVLDDDDVAVSDVTMDPFNLENEDEDDEEQQEDRYAVQTNLSDVQKFASTTKEQDAADGLYETRGAAAEIPVGADKNDINSITDDVEMEKTLDNDEKPVDEDILSEMAAAEEEVIFMSRDSSIEDSDEQQQHQNELVVTEDVDVAVATKTVEEQPALLGLESCTKTSTNYDDYDPDVVMLSSRDHASADADDEVAAIAGPIPDDDENQTPINEKGEFEKKSEFEKNDVKPTMNSIYNKVTLRRSMEIKLAATKEKILKAQKEEEVVVQAIIPIVQSAVEIQAAKDQAMANQVKSALDGAMEHHRDVWYDMSLTSRDESIVQEEDNLSTSIIPPPLSPWMGSDTTGAKDSCNGKEEDGTLSPVNFEGDSVNEGPFQIIIDGAGTPEVNGVYHQDGYYGSACRYSRKGHWKGGPCMFYLCQCRVHDGTRSWFLSLVPDGCPVVTGYFYSAPVTKACQHIPPLQGWDKAVHGQKPRPTLSYRSKLAEENIKLSTEKESLEHQNKTLYEALNQFKETFTQQKEAWSKEKRTWEQQQKVYLDDLSKQRDQMEQNLKDIFSPRNYR
jgi:hypothetical protein